MRCGMNNKNEKYRRLAERIRRELENVKDTEFILQIPLRKEVAADDRTLWSGAGIHTNGQGCSADQ